MSKDASYVKEMILTLYCWEVKVASRGGVLESEALLLSIIVGEAISPTGGSGQEDWTKRLSQLDRGWISKKKSVLISTY